MIVFGTRLKLLGTKPTTETCNNCRTQHSIQLSNFQKYAHVFWIPFFPLGKIAVSECNHCKQELRTNEFPPSTRLAYDNLKRESKTPLWMFSGLALVVIFIVFTSYESKQNHKKNAALIQAPAKGDLFEVRTQDNQYTLYKVADVEGDSVFIRYHRYETNKISGLSDLKTKGDEAYTSESYSFAKAELKKMFEKGEITDIER